MGTAGFPEWLQRSDASDTFLTVILSFIILMLIGILRHIRRMRIALTREALALQKSEEHIRAMGDNLSNVTIFQLVHDPHAGTFSFGFISKGVEHTLGVDRTHIMDDARIVLDLVFEEDMAKLNAALAAATEHLEPTNMEIRILDATGTYKWLHINAMPQYIEQSIVWDGFMMDISDKKAIELSVVEESRNFQNLFETIDDFLLVCDMDGKLLHSNPALEQRLGYSHQELAEMSIFELYPGDAQPDVYRTIAELHSDPSATCRVPLQMRSGAHILVEMNLFQGTWKQTRAIFGVARDVARFQQTEIALRESQKILQLIIDSIPMSIFWKDKDSVYLGCNNAFIQECQLNHIDDVVGKTPFDLFDQPLAMNVIERDQSVLNTNESLMNHSESHTLPDGRIGWREISLIPMRSELGRAIGVLGVWRDVTEQNKAEERLKRTLDDMERFNQLMRGRERRTLELKDEINDLLLELERPKKYRTTAEDMTQ